MWLSQNENMMPKIKINVLFFSFPNVLAHAIHIYIYVYMHIHILSNLVSSSIIFTEYICEYMRIYKCMGQSPLLIQSISNFYFS